MWAWACLWYTPQNRAVAIIFPLIILQTIVTAYRPWITEVNVNNKREVDHVSSLCVLLVVIVCCFDVADAALPMSSQCHHRALIDCFKYLPRRCHTPARRRATTTTPAQPPLKQHQRPDESRRALGSYHSSVSRSCRL